MFYRLPILFFGLASLALADFTYDSTTNITGGSLVGMIKMAGAFSKDAKKALEPINSTTTVKSNQLVTRTGDATQIVDLDKETITHADFAKRTYSVSTFAEMRQALDDMSKKLGQRGGGADPASIELDMKLRETGQQRTVAGVPAHEVIMTTTMQGQDAKSGQRGGMDLTNDMWISPAVAGYKEVRDFYQRLAQKLNWMPGANPMLNRPDVQRAMAEMAKNGGKLDGMVVQSNIQMGGAMDGMPISGPQSPDKTAQRSQSTAPPTSVSEALGAALGSRIGLGGLGRKKREQQAATPDSAVNAPAVSNGSTSLLEMTMQVTRYSSAPVDVSLFQIPAGFQQVKEDPLGQRRR